LWRSLNKENLEELWCFFFKSEVKSALECRALWYVLWGLCEREEFGQYNEEYESVLEQLRGKGLRDSDFGDQQLVA